MNPLLVGCPDCQAPAGTPCHSAYDVHAGRVDAARLHDAETGTCNRCGAPLARGVRRDGEDVTVWHPHPADAAKCPPLPDPTVDWNAYAAATQAGKVPGYPGPNAFVPAPEAQPEDPTETGRRLASQRDDLIAAGVDAADLLIPLNPDDSSYPCPECQAGKCQNCTRQTIHPVTDLMVPCGHTH